MLSSSYSIVFDHAINAPSHEKNVVGGLNAMYKRYLKEEIELISELACNDKSIMGMLPSASNTSPLKFYTNVYILLITKKD